MSDECDMRHAPSAPCAKCEARIAAKTAADHGISPAQLRGKVEALEHRIADLEQKVADYRAFFDGYSRGVDIRFKSLEEAHISFLQNAARMVGIQDDTAKALTVIADRIISLEKQNAAWRGTHKHES